MADKHNNLEEPIVDVTEAVSKTDELFEKNKKKITTITTIIVALFAAVYFYGEFVTKPKEQKAEKEIWRAEQNFKNDSLALALNGRGLTEKGLNAVIDQYGSTPTGELALLYAGIAELKLGNLDAALSNLNDFNTENEMLQLIRFGLIGDIHLEKNDLSKAETFYRRAAESNMNKLTTPYFSTKLGYVLDQQGDLEEAKEVYEVALNKFPATDYKKDLEKALAGVNQRLGN